MDETKLKPCPFCGSPNTNLYFVKVDAPHGFDTVGIFCNWCKQTVILEENEWEGEDSRTREKAIEAWNKRVTMDDLTSRQAVKQLDLFTKTFCRDKSVKNDLVFRCSQCDFQLPDRTCLVKTMARKLCPDYKNFGSMGDL